MEKYLNFRLPMHSTKPSYSEPTKPSYSEPVQNRQQSSSLSSQTHPSVRTRDRERFENIFKKINSGVDVLSRLPTRLDPNIEFSDDEESSDEVETYDYREKIEVKETVVSDKENVCKIKEKTPEFCPNFSKLKQLPFRFQTDKKKNLSYQNFSDKFASSKITSFKRNIPERQNLVEVGKGKTVSPTKNLESCLLKSKLDTSVKSDTDKTFKAPVDCIKKPIVLSNEIIEVNGKGYSILSVIGSGGSCKVYSVFDVENKSHYALKWVQLNNTDPTIHEGYKKEIQYLQKLKDSNRVINMYDFEYREKDLLIVLEHGDIDFSKYLMNEAKLKRLSPLTIKFYWAQMLEAVADIHKYGIVHSDLKPANFLFVAGNLKLIDFGIATSVPDDKTSTFRDDQVGTLNYMSPEAITQLSCTDRKRPVFKIGVKSDVWSLGCILYNLVYGVTPFYSIKTLLQKINAITNPDYEISFKPLSDNLLLDVLKLCLKRNPRERASVEDLLRHPYLTEAAATGSVYTTPSKSNTNLTDILEQIRFLTPKRMQYVTKIVNDLSEK